MLSGNGGLQNTSFFRPPENVVTSAVLDETRFLVRDKRECFTGNSTETCHNIRFHFLENIKENKIMCELF